MHTRLLTLAVLFALLVSVVPAHAEVTLVDPYADPEILLSEDEALKVQQLQDVTYPETATEISPDDTTIVISNYRYSETGGAFLNVENGNIVPIKPIVLPEGEELFPLAATEIVWFTDDLVGQLIFDLFYGPLFYLVDRNTGEASITPVNTGPYFPISLAPNGSRMFAVKIPELEDLRKSQTLKSPFVEEYPKLTTGVDILSKERNGFYAHTDQQRRLTEETVELVIVDLNTGEATTLMNLPEKSALWSYAWSQDGSKFAIIRETIDYLTFGYNRLVDAIVQDTLGGFTPKDNPFFVNNFVDIFDLSTGNLRVEAHRAVDGNGDVAHGVAWSTDGSRYLLQWERAAQIKGRAHPTYLYPDQSYLRFYSVNGEMLGEYRNAMIDAPTEVNQARFISPDEVMINVASGTSFKIYYYNQGSGEFRQISQWDGSHLRVETTRQSRQLIYTFMSFANVPDIYRIGWDGQAIARLTWSNGELEKINNVRVDKVSFTLRNGAVREGFLIQPAGAAFPPKNVPIAFWQEGGPRAPMAQQWTSNVENPHNLLPNFGIAVLHVPLVGRLGFGAERLNALADGTNFGSIDIDEGAEIIGQVVQRGWAQPNQVGVVGCSYGGYFSAQSITRHPQRYAAANPQCSLLDNAYEFTFGLSPLIAYLEGGTPMDKVEEYAQDSPLFNASKVRTPTMLFHGTFDFLPIKFAVDFHDQIEIQKYTVKLMAFDYEGHGLGAPTSQFRAAQEQILWFRKYLGGGTSVAEVPVVEQTNVEQAVIETPVDVAPAVAATVDQQQFDATVFAAAPQFMVTHTKFAYRAE